MPGTLQRDPDYIVPTLIPEPSTESTAGIHDVINPETPEERVWGHAANTVEQAETAVEEAAKALEIWAMTSGTERRNAFFRAAELIGERAEELASAMQIETGQTEAWTAGFNINVGMDFCKEIGGRITTEITQASWNASSHGIGSVVWKEPVGVVFAIAPW